jgi:hypothetical protein
MVKKSVPKRKVVKKKKKSKVGKFLKLLGDTKEVVFDKKYNPKKFHPKTGDMPNDFLYPFFDHLWQIIMYQPIEAAIYQYCMTCFDVGVKSTIQLREEEMGTVPAIANTGNFVKSFHSLAKEYNVSIFFCLVYILGKYAELNEYMNQKKVVVDRMLDFQIYNLDFLFELMEPVNKEFYVYRGIPVGGKFVFPVRNFNSYFSTSVSEKIAAFFKGDGTMYRIKIKKGTKILPLYLIDSPLREWEILLSLKITKLKLVAYNEQDNILDYETVNNPMYMSTVKSSYHKTQFTLSSPTIIDYNKVYV